MPDFCTGFCSRLPDSLGINLSTARVDPDVKAPLVKNSLMLLSQAKVCSKVTHTSGSGLPLGAESNDKFFKALMVDIGLISAHLGLSSVKHTDLDSMLLSNRGGLAEQFVGQQLRAAQTPAMDPQLFYWQRTGGRQGEIDYILQHGNHIVPVEVKSGAAGSMKSLHQFMAEKKLEMAVRLDANPPSVEEMSVKTTQGQSVKYRLLSLPLYLAGNVTHFARQAVCAIVTEALQSHSRHPETPTIIGWEFFWARKLMTLPKVLGAKIAYTKYR